MSDGANLRVLPVDDEETFRSLFTHVLEASG